MFTITSLIVCAHAMSHSMVHTSTSHAHKKKYVPNSKVCLKNKFYTQSKLAPYFCLATFTAHLSPLSQVF